MGIVKFKKEFSINKINSIAEFDKELCDKLIEREICVKASGSDIKADKDGKMKIEKIAKANIEKSKKQSEAVKKLHKPMDLQEQKEAISSWRAKQKKKKNKK